MKVRTYGGLHRATKLPQQSYTSACIVTQPHGTLGAT